MSDIAVIDVIVPAPIVVDVVTVGVAGPPGPAGPEGPQGEPGPAGEGGGADLPTAPINQVLISQGAGIAPVFHPNPTVNLLSATAYVAAADVYANFSMTIREKTLAGLPAPEVGTLANISDSTTDIDGAVITGGGTKHVLARWDGTNWRVVSGAEGGGAGPGGIEQSVQYKEGTTLAGSNQLTFVPAPSGTPEFRVGQDAWGHGAIRIGGVGMSVHDGGFSAALTSVQYIDSCSIRFGMAYLIERTYATLPAASALVGMLCNVSDSTTGTPGSVIAGGGTFHVLARSNGTNWKVVA